SSCRIGCGWQGFNSDPFSSSGRPSPARKRSGDGGGWSGAPDRTGGFESGTLGGCGLGAIEAAETAGRDAARRPQAGAPRCGNANRRTARAIGEVLAPLGQPAAYHRGDTAIQGTQLRTKNV